MRPLGTFPTLTPCFACGHQFNCSSGADYDAAPTAGDVTVCIRCGHLMIFTSPFTLRNPTAPEHVEIMANPQVRKIVTLIGKFKS